MKTLKNQHGFTVTELLIVIVATGVVSGAIFTFTFNYWRASYAQQSSVDSLNTRLNAGDIIRNMLASSTGLTVQPGIIDENAMVAEVGNDLFWEVIHAIPAEITAVDGEFKPVIYFRRIATDSNRDFLINNVLPFEDEYVIYLDGSAGILYLRTLANENAPANTARTSCPPSLATETCPADRVIADNISSIETRYFSRTGNEVDHSSVTDPDTNEFIGPDYTSVEVVELTLNITEKPLLQKEQTTQVSTIIRVALRNS